MSQQTKKSNSRQSSSKETVYLDSDAEITEIIDKVTGSKQKIVALVLPRKAASLQSIVNMRLLKRSATNNNKNVVLITADNGLRPLAGAAGIHVARSLTSTPEIPDQPTAVSDDDHGSEIVPVDVGKVDARKSVGELSDENKDKESSQAERKPAAKEEGEKKKLFKIPNFDSFRKRLVLLIGGGVLFIALIILAIFVWPNAKITVSTTSRQLSGSLSLNASTGVKALDLPNKAIPAELKSAEKISSAEVQATGKKNLGQKASGEVTMTAGSCGPNFPADVPAGSGISRGDKTFITQESVSFTASNQGGNCLFRSEGSVEVVAEGQGSSYNLSPGNLSVAGRGGITASNKNSFSGGTDNVVTIVSQGDIDGAKNRLLSADQENFKKKFLEDAAANNSYVLSSTLKTEEPVVNSSPPADQQANVANVSVKMSFKVLTVSKTDLEKAVAEALNQQLDKDKERISDRDLLANINITTASPPGSENTALTISKDSSAVPKLDEENIKELSKGKKGGEARSAIESFPGVKSVDVDLSPFWVKNVPGSKNKIEVELKEVRDDGN